MSDVKAGARLTWCRVADADALTDGAVKKVAAGDKTIALTRVDGKYGALDNACPHMGGPLGEGTIEYGVLVCPWHGREYNPLTGECASHAEHVATFPVEVREDGIYVGIES